jgi:predicted RND superfamily exporter protein
MNKLLSLSKSILWGTALLTVVAIYFISTLRFDYDFNKFFPVNDPDRITYLKHARLFGNDNDYLLIGLERKAGIFDSTFLNRVDSLSGYIKSLPSVEQVLSPTRLTSPVVEPFGVFQIPYLHLEEPGRFASDSVAIYSTEGLAGSFFSADAKALTIAVQTTPDLQKPPGDTLLNAIQDKISTLKLGPAHLAGKILAQSVFVDRMRSELVVFISASILLLTLFLYLAFRSWWGVLVPLGLVLLTVILTLGLMGALGQPLDLMMVLLPTILFVVGMSDVVHVITRFITALQDQQERNQALQTALKEVALAKFITAFTTSTGFLTLVTTDIEPIAKFGLFTAAGVMIAYLLSITFLPAVLLHVHIPERLLPASRQFLWTRQLRKWLLGLFHWRKSILAGAGALVMLSFYLISTIRIDATLLDDLQDDDPIKEDFRFFEKHFAGVRPFEMHLTAGQGKDFYNLKVLQELEEVEKYLRKEYGLQFIVSPVTVIKSVHRAKHGGQNEEYRLPDTQADLNRLKPLLHQLARHGELNSVIAATSTDARISGKMADIGSLKASEKNRELQQFISKNTDPDYLKAYVTGSAFLLDKNNESLTLNLMQGLIIDVIVISFIMLLMFKSWRMIGIALLPNLFPMLLIAAVMGAAGVNLKVSTAIIFTIAFGIAVDDTIHFMSKLMQELRAGKSPLYAMKRTVLTTGKPIIITSCMLVAGFLTLLFSSFEGTFYMGLLVSLTLIFAMLAELTLLPVLLMYFLKSSPFRNKSKPLIQSSIPQEA